MRLKDIAMPDIDDDMLVAYVDGELDAKGIAAVDAVLAADPTAREKVAALREGAALLRKAYEAPLHQPIPDRLSLQTTTLEFRGRLPLPRCSQTANRSQLS